MLNFLNYINSFRALSIFLIVALHTMHVFSWQQTLNQQKISFIFFGNSTSLFLFISGYLFQHLSAKFDIKKYYASKFNYVILPYLVISLPAILYYVFVSPHPNIDQDIILKPEWFQIIHYYWYGNHAYHFWFMPVIALFYLAGPILIQGDKTTVLYKLLPLLIMISLLVSRSQFPKHNFLHFLSIYVLGMFCSRYKSVINPLLIKPKTVLLFLVLFIITFLIEYLNVFPQFTTINYVQKVFFILIVLGLLIRFDHGSNKKVVDILANTSFGIYFLHGYILYCVYYISSHMHEVTGLVKGNLTMLVLVSFATVMCSAILVLIIKFILGKKSHFFIGNIPSLRSR